VFNEEKENATLLDYMETWSFQHTH